eukprot:6106114-Prymnesium_polylepis.1
MADAYRNPGPLQFAGALAANVKSAEVAGKRAADLNELAAICRAVEATCWPGCPESVIRTALASLCAPLLDSNRRPRARARAAVRAPAPGANYYYCSTAPLTPPSAAGAQRAHAHAHASKSTRTRPIDRCRGAPRGVAGAPSRRTSTCCTSATRHSRRRPLRSTHASRSSHSRRSRSATTEARDAGRNCEAAAVCGIHVA